MHAVLVDVRRVKETDIFAHDMELAIYTALSRLNDHIISKERMKLLVMYIFLFALNYGVPIHPTRYNFTSAYILCHICCILRIEKET